MATIKKNSRVSDYFVEPPYPFASEAARAEMVDQYEDGNLIIFKNLRFDLDYDFLNTILVPRHPDPRTRYQLAKLTEADYLAIDSTPATRVGSLDRDRLLQQDRPRHHIASFIRDQAFRGDRSRLERFKNQILPLREQVLKFFSEAFPDYKVTKIRGSWRLTESRGESLHVDGYQDPHHFHQVKLFVNLDMAPRIWNTGEKVTTTVLSNYANYDLGEYANLSYNDFLVKCNECFFDKGIERPISADLHNIYFDMGDVWIVDTRFIPHQIFFGRRMVSFMFYVDPASMVSPNKHIKHVLDRIHTHHQRTDRSTDDFATAGNTS